MTLGIFGFIMIWVIIAIFIWFFEAPSDIFYGDDADESAEVRIQLREHALHGGARAQESGQICLILPKSGNFWQNEANFAAFCQIL